ncbi:SgcJ/EcaC family oxidoreductase [Roseomonas sp. CCTCC AB2023176]|uniref:SgcJ/EcaC family oxidoreductase n=1 Tax=Roseomonas sp. CCTCC AB2023176 TaxID=3342640 RepID=UPI0035D9B43D
MLRLALLVLLLIPGLAGAQEPPTTPARVLEAWAAAYATNEGPRAAALYAEDARLWGSVSREQTVGRDAMATYFGRVRPGASAIAVRFGEHAVREVSPGFAVASGHYTFVRVQPGGAEQLEPSRFSMAMTRLPDGTWRIVDHHSSRLPGG